MPQGSVPGPPVFIVLSIVFCFTFTNSNNKKCLLFAHIVYFFVGRTPGFSFCAVRGNVGLNLSEHNRNCNKTQRHTRNSEWGGWREGCWHKTLHHSYLKKYIYMGGSKMHLVSEWNAPKEWATESTAIQNTENRHFKGRSTTRASSSGASCFSVRAPSSYRNLGEDGHRGKKRLRNTRQRSTSSHWAHKQASKLSPRGVWSPLRAPFVSERCDSRWAEHSGTGRKQRLKQNRWSHSIIRFNE